MSTPTAVAVERPFDVSGWLRALRFPLVVVAVGLGLAVVLAALGAEPARAPLDPRSTDPDGAHALAALLAQRGLPVTVATSTADLRTDPSSVIVVSDPGALSAAALRAVAATASNVVLVAPHRAALAAFGIDATADAVTPQVVLPPGCSLPAATAAGTAQIAGTLYAVPANAVARTCYAEQGDAAVLDTTRPTDGQTFVIGSASTLSNHDLGDDGNAALALGLIDTGGAITRVQWVPGALDTAAPTGPRRGLFRLLPARLLWATGQLGVTLLILALWRARRLGKPVVEPLPVVVRAAETVEGRARLMHAARSRDSAARALRAATVRRIARGFSLGADASPDAVTALAAERSGKPESEVRRVLYGGEPADDADLVRLAQDLPRLEAAVRDDAPHPPEGDR